MSDKGYENDNVNNVERNNNIIRERTCKTSNIKKDIRKENINLDKNNLKNCDNINEKFKDYNKEENITEKEKEQKKEYKKKDYSISSDPRVKHMADSKKTNGYINKYEKCSEEYNNLKNNSRNSNESGYNDSDTLNKSNEVNNRNDIVNIDEARYKKIDDRDTRGKESIAEAHKIVEEKKNKEKNKEAHKDKNDREKSKKNFNNEMSEKLKPNNENLNSGELPQSPTVEKCKSSSKEKSRHRNRSRERSRNRSIEKSRNRSIERSKNRSRKRHKDFSSSSDAMCSSKRRRNIHFSKEKSRNRSKEKGRIRIRNRYRSKEKNKNLSIGSNSSNSSNSISNSSMDSEERYYRDMKKKSNKKNFRHSSDKHSSECSIKNGYEKNERSNFSEVAKSKESRRQKKKTKWDTVDENLLKNNLFDNNINSLLQKQNASLIGNLVQNGKITQLSRSIYELDNDKKQRKLYIGNIPPNCKQEDVIDFFNDSLLSIIKDTTLSIKIGDVQLMPVIKCEIFNIESRFCFLEFRTIEITLICLKLDSLAFNNYCLRIGRPHDYVAPPNGDPIITSVFPDIEAKILDLLKPSKSVYKKGVDDDNKLYIQNLPHDLKDDQIKDLLEQFGKLKSFNIIKDLNTGLNKGYGFFEYEDNSCTQVSIHALNGFVCGQNILNVKKANFSKNQNNLYAQNPNNIVIPSNVEVPVSLLPNSISQKILNNSIIGLQIQASRKVGERPSRVVQLTNAVFQEDLIIDSQYEQILKEIKEEAEKYGPLQSIVIPKPNKDLSFTEGVGKIFFHYFDETTARKAQYMFNGRLFEKRVVCAAFYSEDHFLKGKYVLS